MTTETEKFVIFVCEGPPKISDDLPDGYSFLVWTPTMRRPVPATMGLRSALWAAFKWCGLFANGDYRVVYIRHGERIVHRSCVLPRYFRWPFMGKDDVQVGSTWTEPAQRGKGLASVALAHIVRTMATDRRRFWYVSRESNQESIRVCVRVGFEFVGYGRRTVPLGCRVLGRLEQTVEARRSGADQRLLPDAPDAAASARAWYSRYYSVAGSDRNDLRTNRGILFQVIASERSVIKAFYHLRVEAPAFNVLDVGCGSGGGWYQLFRLGVKPRRTVGIDIQLDRLTSVSSLYPQCAAINADAVSMPFANSSFDLVVESTMFATLPDDRVRAGIAGEMLRVCRPNGHLLLVDWRIPKFWDDDYKALTRAEVRRLFGVGKTVSVIGVFPGALIPPLGRLLSTYAGLLYFLVAGLCPPLVGQVVYLLRRHIDPEVKS